MKTKWKFVSGSELYHIYEVHLVSEHIWCDDYLVRSFYLKNVKTGETRTVTQFHFLSWPEGGVPASTKALLEFRYVSNRPLTPQGSYHSSFRRKVNKSYRGRSCPIVVHCSDGAGRTGTYCLIDMVLSRMAKGAKEIDIAATLEHLRDQRPRMVSRLKGLGSGLPHFAAGGHQAAVRVCADRSGGGGSRHLEGAAASTVPLAPGDSGETRKVTTLHQSKDSEPF